MAHQIFEQRKFTRLEIDRFAAALSPLLLDVQHEIADTNDRRDIRRATSTQHGLDTCEQLPQD